jgi:hypothetical protein
MKKLCASVVWIAVMFPVLAAPVCEAQAPSGQPSTANESAAPKWTIDQAVTCSVHDAWVLGGKNEQGFFDIVEALAELSAQKRDLTLPDKEAVGRQFGDYIKAQAKSDRDQLLYAVVDRAVRKYGVPATAATKQ